MPSLLYWQPLRQDFLIWGLWTTDCPWIHSRGSLNLLKVYDKCACSCTFSWGYGLWFSSDSQRNLWPKKWLGNTALKCKPIIHETPCKVGKRTVSRCLQKVWLQVPDPCISNRPWVVPPRLRRVVDLSLFYHVMSPETTAPDDRECEFFFKVKQFSV